MMRSRLLVGMAALGIAVAGCAGKQTPANRISSEGELLFNGRTSPDVNCYKCHNGDGSGTWRGPDLAKRVPNLTDQKIVTTIMKGPGFMPSFKGKVSDAQAQEIARWLHGRFPLAGAP
jgi:cytochrome c551